MPPSTRKAAIEGVLGRLVELKKRAVECFASNLGADAAALPGTILTVMIGVTTIGITASHWQ